MRNLSKMILTGAAATAGIIGFSSPASAAVELCYEVGNAQPQCASTNVNVLVNQQTGDPVTASDNDNTTNVTYSFTSSTETTLVQNASGQADVASGDADGTINQITFSIVNGSANLVTFNLVPLGPQSPGTDATSVIVTLAGGGTVTIPGLDGNGNNFFGIRATGGDSITSLSFGGFSPDGSGIQALNQVRLNLVPTQTAPVPEPGTWAMMLIGFGGMGVAMRRRRRNGAQLAQVA
jgi:hypothetical protein